MAQKLISKALCKFLTILTTYIRKRDSIRTGTVSFSDSGKNLLFCNMPGTDKKAVILFISLLLFTFSYFFVYYWKDI